MRVGATRSTELFETKLDIHDRKQFELKLEYQPSGTDPRSEYLVEAILFIPRSLNVTQESWPREAFYADLHNYVRLKTPVLSFEELLSGPHSPLVQLEERLTLGLLGSESELVYDAKMLACVLRATLRRFARGMKDRCAHLAQGIEGDRGGRVDSAEEVQSLARKSVAATRSVLQRFRIASAAISRKYPLTARTSSALRLCDEYMSLVVEQAFRRVVVQMDDMPRTTAYTELRRELMEVVLADERYRRGSNMTSVISPEGDNEEYIHRMSFLKKFCMNILFLKVHRTSTRQRWEEVLFAIAAGGSMAFALGVGLFAQSRYPQASFNFFLLAVIGYMLKDRIKDGLRRVFAAFAGRLLYERNTHIVEPVTHDHVGVCKEKIDYGSSVEVAEDVRALRASDDLTTAAQGELAETVLRYRKRITLESKMLPQIADGMVSGVTDIIRLNVDRLLHDMDDPELAIEYVDVEDFSIERVRASKSYRLDIAFRFAVDDGKTKESRLRVVRLVLDRNGIKRMNEVTAPTEPSVPPVYPPMTPPRATG